MKKFFTTICLFIGCLLTVSAEELPLIQNVQAYESLSLNGAWNYIVDVQEEGYYDYRMNPTRWGFFQNAKPQRPEDLIEYDFDKSPTMQIPSDWNTQDERLFFYEGTVWFKKSITIKKSDYAESKALLYFGAVNYDCRVWVNTKEVGHHIGGFTPFNYDVTDLLKDGDNTIIVKVDNKRHAEDVPTQIFDWWNYGGITRNVMLVKVPTVFIGNYTNVTAVTSQEKSPASVVKPSYIEDYSIHLMKADAKAKQRRLLVSVKLSEPLGGHLLTVSIPELKLSMQLLTNAQGKAGDIVSIPAKKLSLWSPDNPKRYRVEIKHYTTSIIDSIGFRSIETRDKQILLNGQPIFLKGISIHNEKPNGGGRANTVEDARSLLGWAKELGCNFVRLAHYPHHEEMVREAEKMGILVWSEIPVYWTIAWKNPKTYENAQNQLHDMIRRDHNRANVIIWSIANETPHSKERDTFLGNLAKYARSQDSTRLISMAMEVTGASNYVNRLNDNMNQYVDVVSFNQYIGWYRDVNDAPKMKWEIPYNKPVIVSEFGGGAKYGYHGEKNQRWTEEFQENLYRENCAMLDKIEGLSGTTPWILKDFRSPRRVLPDVQDYYNRKGLFSDKGEKKKAFYVLKQWYESK
jgi:beta-glucuronidase